MHSHDVDDANALTGLACAYCIECLNAGFVNRLFTSSVRPEIELLIFTFHPA